MANHLKMEEPRAIEGLLVLGFKQGKIVVHFKPKNDTLLPLLGMNLVKV
jgi:hypothetical protein